MAEQKKQPESFLEMWRAGKIHVMPDPEWEEFQPEPLTEEEAARVKELEEKLFGHLKTSDEFKKMGL